MTHSLSVDRGEWISKQHVGIWNAWNFILEDLTLFIINGGHSRTGDARRADPENYHRDFMKEQHAGIGIGKRFIVFFVSFISLWLKHDADYWLDALCGFQSSRSHYHVFTCSSRGDRVTWVPRNGFLLLFLVPFLFFYRHVYWFLLMTMKLWILSLVLSFRNSP